MISKTLYSSKKQTWETPRDFFAKLDQEFDFELDAAADFSNALCERYFAEADNALAQPWAPYRVFCNPPYGKNVGAWVAKAKHEAMRGALVVCLLASRTDTRWFHDHVLGFAEIRFIKGRLHFDGHEDGAPFPSLLAIYRGFAPLRVVE